MFRFHIPYKGPPAKCRVRDYWFLFAIASFAAASVLVLAVWFANSTAALVDSIHAFIHSILYAITAYTEWLFYKKNYTQEKRQRISMTLGFLIYAPFILLGLGYIVIFEAWPKFINPTPVNESFMIISGIVGFSANLFAISGFNGIKKYHCIKDSRHRFVYWDAVGDLLISIAVVIGGFSIHSFRIYRIDSIITFGAALWIIYQVYKILKDEFREFVVPI